jgi:hypothetical protein
MLVPGHFASIDSVDPEMIIIFSKLSLAMTCMYSPALDEMCKYNFQSMGKVLCFATNRLSDE